MATTEKPKYKVIGTRPIRPDGVDKVTGRAQYGSDVKLSGMLHGAILRSPHAHAKIKSIDTSGAEALAGVHAVITSKDMPEIGSRIADLGEGMFDMEHLKRNILATDKVLYKGHAVAAVAAEDLHTALEAIKFIKVDYEPLPVVIDVVEAMQPGAPILHEDLKTDQMGEEIADSGPTNIAKTILHEKGDSATEFKSAAIVIEREFTTATVHQGYIEPHTATAFWNADNHVTCWTSTQGSFAVRQQLGGLLQLPLSKVKVIPMEIGGGFGGKIVVYLQPIAALLSKKCFRPVQVVMDRTDVLQATGPTPGSWMRVKIGCDGDGMIVAAEAEMAFEAGGFPGSPIPAACATVFACYDVPNGKVIGYDVCLNRPATKAYRAPGATQAAFAVETIVDEICRELDICPLEFRMKNASKEGTRRIDGPKFARIGMYETVAAIKHSDHWKTPLKSGTDPLPPGAKPASKDQSVHGNQSTVLVAKNNRRGRGVASGFWFNAGLKSSVTATVNPDGTVSLIEGSTDIGGSRASLAMQLAETLGIEAEDVVPQVVDTDSVGYTDVTGGSRVTYSTGIATYKAGLDIQRQMVQRAADMWDVPANQVKYEDGHVVGPNESVPFKEFAAKASKGEPITGRGSTARNEPGGAFGTHCVDVEVDVDTGKVHILRYTACQDAGTAIHPSYVEGQIQGGAVQGIGWALNEEYFYDENGEMKNASFLDYRMPTSLDLPMIDTIIVEVPNPGHPYGVRGVGEVPIVPPPAAIANAIHDAIGVRMRQLPMSPPKVLHQLLAGENA
jgi:xanthine dehydrogenase molybdenum-binding subunit